MYGMCEEEDEEEQEPSREKTEENDRMQLKIRQLKTKMDATKKVRMSKLYCIQGFS